MIPLVFVPTSCIADWVKWRRCAADLADNRNKRSAEACVRINLVSMKADGYDFLDRYPEFMTHLWEDPNFLFICVNEKGEETARYYMGNQVVYGKDSINPAPLWWEIEQAAKKEEQEALITLRVELRKRIGWKP